MTRQANILPCEPLAVRGSRAAELIGVSDRTLADWVAGTNPPPSFIRGGVRLYPVRELREWLADQIDRETPAQ